MPELPADPVGPGGMFNVKVIGLPESPVPATDMLAVPVLLVTVADDANTGFTLGIVRVMLYGSAVVPVPVIVVDGVVPQATLDAIVNDPILGAGPVNPVSPLGPCGPLSLRVPVRT